MKPDITASIGAPSPDRASISRLVLLICCVGLLVGPTVGAVSGDQSPSVGSPAAQQVSRSLQASGQQSTPTPTANRSTNSETTARSGQNNSTTRSPPSDPIATIEDVKLFHGDDVGAMAPDMRVDVMKVNKSTVAIVYRHNQTTKTWYTTDTDVVTSPRWGISGDNIPHWASRRFSNAIAETQVFKQKIEPFARSPESYPKTGVKGYKQEARENPRKFPHIPGPVEATKDIYRAAVNGLSSAAAKLIDGFLWVVLHLPAPGQPTDPTTWFPDAATPLTTTSTPDASVPSAVAGDIAPAGSPSGGVMATNASTAPNATATQPSPPNNWNVSGWWGAVWTIYGGLASLVVLPVFVAWIYAWSKETNTPRERDQYVRQLACTVGLVVGGVLLLPFALHLTNELAVGIVPKGETFMSTPGNVAKLGLGLALGGVLLAVESGLVLVAILILFVEWILVFFIVAAWPLFAVCLGSGNRYLRPYGESALVAFVSILVLKVVQAIWLRFLLELPLSWSQPGMTLLTIGATIVGLTIGFIYLPYYVVTNLLPEFVTRVGSGRAGSATGYRQSVRQYAGDAVTAQGSERPRNSTMTSKSGATTVRTRTRPTSSEASAMDAATDGGPTSEAPSQSARGRNRARRVEAIRQRAYRQDDTFDHFPDNGDVTDTVERTHTTADIGSTGRTPDGAAGAVTETTESAVGTAESAAGKVGTAVTVAADARRTAKSHWYGVKRYWRSALPGHRSRRPTKPVEPLRTKARRHAKSGWQSVKQHGRAGTDRVVDRERRQRQEQRRDHVREQQHSGDETTETTTETDTDTTTEETVTDETGTERRRYYTRQDHQKYGDALSERQKSSIRRHAERRYRERADESEPTEEASTENDTDDTETDSDDDE